MNHLYVKEVPIFAFNVTELPSQTVFEPVIDNVALGNALMVTVSALIGLPIALITFTFPVKAVVGVIEILVAEFTTKGTLVVPI